jgi:hypothetical protein
MSFFGNIGGFVGKQLQQGIAGPLLGILGLNTTEQNPNSIYQDALTQARSVGYQSSNRYILFFERVPNIGFEWDNKRLSLSCVTATTPQKSFTSYERDISGPLRKVPYLANYDMSGEFRFMCSSDMYEYYAFSRWMDNIIDPVSRIVSYYEDIIGNLVVCALPRSIGAESSGSSQLGIPFLGNIQLGNKETKSAPLSYGTAMDLAQEGKIFAYKLSEIYPKTIALSGFDSGAATQSLMVNVTFNFREVTDISQNAELVSAYMKQIADMYGPAMDENGNESGFGSLVNFGINTAAMFSKP